MSNTPLMEGINPAACKRIIIVGAGGFGREVLHWAGAAWPAEASKIAGFLSNDPHKLEGYDKVVPILGSPDDFNRRPGDGLVLAIGIPVVRRQVTESLLARGCEFLTLIHPTAIVAPTAQIAAGAVICPYAIISDAARVGSFAVLNYHSSLGHDASVGDFAVLSPYATLGGGAVIQDDVFLGLHASVGPGKQVGAGSKVSANACALEDTPCHSLVFGVPGKVGPLIGTASPCQR